jgi:hypothetical protein
MVVPLPLILNEAYADVQAAIITAKWSNKNMPYLFKGDDGTVYEATSYEQVSRDTLVQEVQDAQEALNQANSALAAFDQFNAGNDAPAAPEQPAQPAPDRNEQPVQPTDPNQLQDVQNGVQTLEGTPPQLGDQPPVAPVQ